MQNNTKKVSSLVVYIGGGPPEQFSIISICNPTAGLGHLSECFHLKSWVDGIKSQNFHYVSDYVFCCIS